MAATCFVGAWAWLYLWPPTGVPFEDGPVAVLGGDPERLAAGLALSGVPGERDLVLSAGSEYDYGRLGGDCDEPRVWCLRPVPESTWDEARGVAALARDRGWSQITVVTSDFHVTRTRLLMHRCIDADVRVVAVATPRSITSRLRIAAFEAAATIVSAAVYHDC
ncbi:ElyC/SanA/YdcF family protein [Egicoccus sp. AB-alg2]|uniref:ElyC/SanA/YdcF family protein n=1 Tax=Egicoccus sp. AB-alg2 TaxID=3242693 RepID=UPI00359D6801